MQMTSWCRQHHVVLENCNTKNQKCSKSLQICFAWLDTNVSDSNNRFGVCYITKKQAENNADNENSNANFLGCLFYRAGKIRFFGAWKSVPLKASSGKRAPQNFVHFATFRGTQVHLIVYLIMHQIKYLMERWSSAIKFCNFFT